MGPLLPYLLITQLITFIYQIILLYINEAIGVTATNLSFAARRSFQATSR